MCFVTAHSCKARGVWEESREKSIWWKHMYIAEIHYSTMWNLIMVPLWMCLLCPVFFFWCFSFRSLSTQSDVFSRLLGLGTEGGMEKFLHHCMLVFVQGTCTEFVECLCGQQPWYLYLVNCSVCSLLAKYWYLVAFKRSVARKYAWFYKSAEGLPVLV